MSQSRARGKQISKNILVAASLRTGIRSRSVAVSLDLFALWYNSVMANSSRPLTEADILFDVVAPEEPMLNQEFARAVLSFRFNDTVTNKIRGLLQKNNAGTITAEEKAELEKYMRVGQFLDLMQAKARLSLQPRSAS